MRDPAALGEQFHLCFGLPVRVEPGLPAFDERLMRHEILCEEFEEYRAAAADSDLVEIADALGGEVQ